MHCEPSLWHHAHLCLSKVKEGADRAGRECISRDASKGHAPWNMYRNRGSTLLCNNQFDFWCVCLCEQKPSPLPVKRRRTRERERKGCAGQSAIWKFGCLHDSSLSYSTFGSVTSQTLISQSKTSLIFFSTQDVWMQKILIWVWSLAVTKRENMPSDDAWRLSECHSAASRDTVLRHFLTLLNCNE